MKKPEVGFDVRSMLGYVETEHEPNQQAAVADAGSEATIGREAIPSGDGPERVGP